MYVCVTHTAQWVRKARWSRRSARTRLRALSKPGAQSLLWLPPSLPPLSLLLTGPPLHTTPVSSQSCLTSSWLLCPRAPPVERVNPPSGTNASIPLRSLGAAPHSRLQAPQPGMILCNESLNCVQCPVGEGGGAENTAAAPTDAYARAPGGGGGVTLPPLSLTPSGHLVVALCLGFIGTLGFLSNFLVLTLFCRYRTLRTPMNLLLVSISFSDLLVCVLGTPFSFAASTQGRWLIGRVGCVWYGFVNSCLGKTVFPFCCALISVMWFHIWSVSVRAGLRPSVTTGGKIGYWCVSLPHWSTRQRRDRSLTNVSDMSLRYSTVIYSLLTCLSAADNLM